MKICPCENMSCYVCQLMVLWRNVFFVVLEDVSSYLFTQIVFFWFWVVLRKEQLPDFLCSISLLENHIGYVEVVYHQTLPRRHFLSVRAVNHWNSLPTDVVSSPTLSTFKSCLHTHWSDIHYVSVFDDHAHIRAP